jgi:hypothetical protein
MTRRFGFAVGVARTMFGIIPMTVFVSAVMLFLSFVALLSA